MTARPATFFSDGCDAVAPLVPLILVAGILMIRPEPRA